MRIFFIFIFLNVFYQLNGQVVDSILQDSIVHVTQPIKKISVSPVLEKDSIHLNYFNLGDVYKKETRKDTLLETTHIYNPISKGINPYADLGNIGSAHLPLVYQPNKKIGLNIGQHQFDLYFLKLKNLKFYNTNRPFTDLFYSQGLGQNNTQFHGAFAKNFTRGIHFSIEYQKIIHQLSSQISFNQNAIYQSQTAEISSLITGFWYQSKTNRYNAFLSFNSNYIEQRNYGGVMWNDDIAKQIDTAAQSVLFSIPLSLSNDGVAKTRNSAKKVALKQLYQLSSLHKGNALVIGYDAAYEITNNKFYDSSPELNYYKNFYVDKRGLRRLIHDNILTNEISLKWINHKMKESKSILSVGILDELHHLTYEPDTTNIHDLFGIASLNIPISKYGLLKAKGKLGLANSTGDFSLDGDFDLSSKKYGQISFGGYLTRFQPNISQSKLIISSIKLWENDFDRISSFGLKGSYFLPKYNFRLDLKTHSINNFVFLNQNQFYEQKNGLINLLEFAAQVDFNLGILHSTNRVIFQKSPKQLPLPKFIYQNSLFIQTRIFKKRMLTKLGADFFLAESYKSNRFNPILGTFYLQDEILTPKYPLINIFLDIKVQNFRAFFKLENIYGQFTTDVFYQIPYYLKREMDFRFGIHWDFWDQKRNSSKSKISNTKPKSL